MNNTISKRGQEVLQLVAHELTAKEIAAELYIAEHSNRAYF